MKKLLLSFVVIILFTFYSIYQKNTVSKHSLTATNTAQSTTNDIISTPAPIVGGRGPYNDGEYTGNVADAFYGNIQVKILIQEGKISDVNFLQYPNDRGTSIEINTQAMPILRSETIKSQNANVDIVSGATDSSTAYVESLKTALSKAKS